MCLPKLCHLQLIKKTLVSFAQNLNCWEWWKLCTSVWTHSLYIYMYICMFYSFSLFLCMYAHTHIHRERDVYNNIHMYIIYYNKLPNCEIKPETIWFWVKLLNCTAIPTYISIIITYILLCWYLLSHHVFDCIVCLDRPWDLSFPFWLSFFG